MIQPATAATTSSTRPGSVSCSRSFPTPNNAPYTSTQPAIQSIRLARPSADARTSGARRATGPKPAREGRGRPRRHDVVRLARIAAHEAAIEVVHEIARPPVELRGDRGHEGRRERGDHEPAERGREIVDHHPDVAGLRVLEIGEQDQRGE